MRKGLFSVIVPAYQQGNTISKDLLRLQEILIRSGHPYEIVCVVDGFEDNTFKNAKTLAGTNKNIRVIGYEQNRGKGYAVRYGMVQSKGDIVGFIDAGMDIDPEGLLTLLGYFKKYNPDIVIGSKRHNDSSVKYPWQRKLLSTIYQNLVFLMFGLRVKDTQVGLKAFKKEVLVAVLPRVNITSFAFDIELLSVADYLGFKKIMEIPVKVQLVWKGSSSVTNKRFVMNVLGMFYDTFLVFSRLKINNYYSDENKSRWLPDPQVKFNM